MKHYAEDIEKIYKDAADIIISNLIETRGNKKLIPEISEGEIMDKKFKSGLYKGLSIAIDEVRFFRDSTKKS